MAIRQGNDFTWGPIAEVAKLFAGIFVTIVPVLAMLKAGSEGAFAPLLTMLTGPDGQPNNAAYFWLTGSLSSFLDNAPTYLVFFNAAGGDPQVLMTTLSTTLVAISAGAVFMGANTYIGNAPNFMVKAICEEAGVKMPSFFGYMGWSIVFLLPCFALITWLYFL
jgi:Na+/H+ antiporter NhaD/arsenite permease-like protein